ncbi:MAG: F0F1 ATP synthase subunit delta [Peptococcaceae bacterium]|nr:F0F1 ATP synthase subunit delta [Peptococcaceae bacterium]MDH7523717.1 F0F1 ATP synthase subunit delta [Peptococcaceae bacterium]
MINRTVPRRYAQALLMIAVERDTLEEYEKELERFREILLGEPHFKEFMDNPKVLPEEKKKVLKSMIAGQLNPLVCDFLFLIVDKRRENLYLEIIEEFKNYADQTRNIIDAEVRSAVALTDKDYRELEQRLARASGKKVRLRSVIDTSLIGGIAVRIGDTVIDGSVTKKLSLLKNRLQQSQFEGIGVIK